MSDQQRISAVDHEAENRELAEALEKVEEAEAEIVRGEADLREAVRELDEIEQHSDHHKPVDIRVNNNPVTMPGRYATGLEIKEAAIRDGVDIKIDFVLFAELPDGKEKVVKDDQTVDLHHDKCFEAIDNDDHS
ncbi:multiubiquitin domain-containing protein [Paraburkholderia sp. J41]|uniref:multiubiquitin domain-containing protein n=1 Tax=Paraburkholderia sp. J41 TaxID=2805433 RepID=UPI002AC31326|nr:multiubiquitin domain-containing protein [Paraburkholderia sp. J41]